MLLAFEKWHGCRNDFIVVWLGRNDESYLVPSLQRQAARLCSKRGDGIGADGILILHTEERRDITPHKMSVINADGSLAQNCGNGLRCAALSVYRRHEQARALHTEPLSELTLELGGDTKMISFLGKSRDTGFPLVAVTLGRVQLNKELAWFDEAKAALRAQEAAGLLPRGCDFFAAEVGNPHLGILLDEPSTELLAKMGPALQRSPLADGINLHLVSSREASAEEHNKAKQLLGQGISEVHTALVWERGVGPTPACGSGAGAIVAASLSQGLNARDEWMAVDMPGGRLYARQAEAKLPVVVAGPAAFVFAGQVEV